VLVNPKASCRLTLRLGYSSFTVPSLEDFGDRPTLEALFKQSSGGKALKLSSLELNPRWVSLRLVEFHDAPYPKIAGFALGMDLNSIVAALGLPMPPSRASTWWGRQPSGYSHLHVYIRVALLFQNLSRACMKVIADEMYNLDWLKSQLDDENIQPDMLRLGNGYFSSIKTRISFLSSYADSLGHCVKNNINGLRHAEHAEKQMREQDKREFLSADALEDTGNKIRDSIKKLCAKALRIESQVCGPFPSRLRC